MGYMFGTREELTCIVDVPLKVEKEHPLCLAYKTSSFAVLAPAYLRDDGYVLAVKGSLREYYPLPKGDELKALQQSGALPNPLPVYHITPAQYAFGYLLWLALLIGLLSLWVERAFKQRRSQSLQTNVMPSTSDPELRTKTDRWLYEEAKKLLEPGEVVQHQAYGTNQDLNAGTLSALSAKALYAVLTNRRLILIHSRVGAFGPLRENRNVSDFARGTIVHVKCDERHLCFVFEDGSRVDLFVEWSERHLSNQKRFLRDVPRLVGAQKGFEVAGALAST